MEGKQQTGYLATPPARLAFTLAFEIFADVIARTKIGAINHLMMRGRMDSSQTMRSTFQINGMTYTILT
jgi:hypothetical protein